jgi:glucokinase
MLARRTIGVDLGGTKLLAGAVDSGLEVHHRAQRTVAGLDQAALLDIAVDAVLEARESAGGEVEAVGFGIPCLIDQRTGVAVIAVNLPLADVAFADVMAERLGLPVFVDNDGNVAALAEHRGGAARGASEAVILTIGTGIGGGLILRGEPYRGAIGSGAELGHIVIDMDGPRCQGNCPNRGCVEALASGTALAREARRLAADYPDSGLARVLRDGRELAGPLVTELAHDGDAAAVEAIELIGSRLGVAIASLVNILNPEVVVIGGGVIAAGELLLAPARAVVAQRALPPSRDEVRIVAARFGVEAGMIGAAALAFDALEGRGVGFGSSGGRRGVDRGTAPGLAGDGE